MNRSILLLSKCAEELQYEPHSEIDSNYPIILRSVHEHRGASNIHENIEVFAFLADADRFAATVRFTILLPVTF